MTATTKLKDTCSLEEKPGQTYKGIKEQNHHFANHSLYSQSCGFSSSHVWMRELNHKEGWVPKNWCFWIVVLEKTLENPLDSKEIKPVNPKRNQLWIFIGRTGAETLILWPTQCKNPTHSLMLGKIEGRKRSRQQRIRWLDGNTNSMDMSFSKLRDSEGQGSLECCSPCGHKESDTT